MHQVLQCAQINFYNWKQKCFFKSFFTFFQIHPSRHRHHHYHHHHHQSTEEQSTVSLLIQLAQLGLSAHLATMSSSESECLLESIHSWSWNHLSIVSFSESASNAFGWSCNCWCWYKCGGESIWWCLSAASWCCKSASVFLFLVTLNFATKKFFRLIFAQGLALNLNSKLLRAAFSHENSNAVTVISIRTNCRLSDPLFRLSHRRHTRALFYNSDLYR